ncbi:actin-binding protein WASF2 isoform X1 [Lepeophtheirus salmonis]|uniref:actin-binding protein WASF2 isoform X1 n=1 Tax=Lepeophtheirus salmonis TaxID=72036 RepID=UPI001AE28D39|nr:wiskott-Aldrich syndrome protein family member 2-like isoform X1 [Lepeophtheirus salmonis]
MPLYIHQVKPTQLGRLGPESKDANLHVDSLEEMNNRTMVNVIRQLSNLTEIAHEIFLSLESMSDAIQKRTDDVGERLEKLTLSLETMKNSKTKRISGFTEMVLNDDSWSSNYDTSSGFFTPESRPKAVSFLYESNCDPIPNFEILQPYTNNVDSIAISKKYTNPDFFFYIWREAMLTEAAKAMMYAKNSIRKNRKNVDRNYVPHKIILKRDMIRQREEKAGNVALLQIPKENFRQSNEDLKVESAAPTPPPPLLTPDIPVDDDLYYQFPDTPIKEEPESPTPPVSEDSFPLPPPPFIPDDSLTPPPPPPPPPVLSLLSAQPLPSLKVTTHIDQLQSVNLKPVPPQQKNTSSHQNLLEQIQAGKTLRKTNFDSEEKDIKPKSFINVEDILAHVLEQRRDAVMDDEESSSDEEYFQF